MSTAGYLQDAKNQQSRLATILTNKGITASATEKYNSLVDKVEQIEELKGEERTLENFTSILDEPKQVVQLEYPDDTTRTLNVKLANQDSAFSTVNVTRCGKNLMRYPYANRTQTINGVTFTVNTDGTIAVSGTATATATFYVHTLRTVPNLIGQTITLSGCPNGGGDNKYRLRYQQTGVHSDVGKGVTFTVTKLGEIVIQIFANQTVDNLIFKPQIELGSVSSDYEQYTGTSYIPSTTGEVTGITTLYPITTLLTDGSTVFTDVSGDVYKTIVPSDGKNGIIKVWQPNVTSSIDSNIVPENIKKDVSILGTTGDYICNYSYDDTTKELVLLL